MNVRMNEFFHVLSDSLLTNKSNTTGYVSPEASWNEMLEINVYSRKLNRRLFSDFTTMYHCLQLS
jgi:hypothetical protein